MVTFTDGYATVVLKNGEYERTVADLRHVYEHLTKGTFKNPKELADGLLAPCIRRLENAANGSRSPATPPWTGMSETEVKKFFKDTGLPRS